MADTRNTEHTFRFVWADDHVDYHTVWDGYSNVIRYQIKPSDTNRTFEVPRLIAEDDFFRKELLTGGSVIWKTAFDKVRRYDGTIEYHERVPKR